MPTGRSEWLERTVDLTESNVVLCAPVRTAIGTYGGSFKEIAPPDLGCAVISETLSRANIDSGSIDTVVIGQVVQAGAKMNPARQAAIKAGIPVSVPAMTINRVCGLGAQAIATAAQEIMLGFAQSASPAAWRIWTSHLT